MYNVYGEHDLIVNTELMASSPVKSPDSSDGSTGCSQSWMDWNVRI